jgi:xylulokinase
MEGVTLGMAYGLHRMGEVGVRPEVIRLTGGGSNSPVWRQMCADVFGYPVVRLRSSEGAALGAAIPALATVEKVDVSVLTPHLAPVDEGTRLEPRRDFDYAARLAAQNLLRDRLFSA